MPWAQDALSTISRGRTAAWRVFVPNERAFLYLGKTALQRARTVHRLDDAALLSVARPDPKLLVTGDKPVLIDEPDGVAVVPLALLGP